MGSGRVSLASEEIVLNAGCCTQTVFSLHVTSTSLSDSDVVDASHLAFSTEMVNSAAALFTCALQTYLGMAGQLEQRHLLCRQERSCLLQALRGSHTLAFMPYCSEPQTQAVVANTLCVRIKSKSDDAPAMQCACCFRCSLYVRRI